MKEMTIDTIVISPENSQPVVLLKELTGEKYLPIWIGIAEAQSILIKIQKVKITRPLSHDLIWSIITNLSAVIDKVVINDIKDDTFYGEIVINKNNKQVIIDARPSDALALAVRTGAPIYAEDSVINQAGVMLDDGGEDSTRNARSEGLSKEDLAGLSAYTDFINSLDFDDFDENPSSD